MADEAVDGDMVKLLDTLDEAQRRWFLAREATRLGRGGIRRICAATGVSKPTIIKGMRELRQGRALRSGGSGIRAAGGGRKRLEERDPAWARDLETIMEQTTAGDPMSLLRWSSRSTYQIRDALARLGHQVSEDTVQRRLRDLEYSLQGNAKDKEGAAPPERDAQFRYINRLARNHLAAGQPVLSVDTKKKERVGEFKNAGRTWRPKQQPVRVNVYDFPHLGEGPAIPYGAFDPARNEGLVNVGMSHDTAEFAVASIRRWWTLVGRRHYPQAQRLLICADGGGSNAARSRAWKYYIQRLADQTRLTITVCHYPPGTSKWNKIEHRMFSFISLHWQGQPLVSYETVVQLISSTRTRTGLRVKAVLDPREYATGVEIADEDMAALKVRAHRCHPQWNYSIMPRSEGHTHKAQR
ncbi:MAG: ISAzo13 family transposase [Acidobacteria bacterium]|nr:ISAzo13 family transposase [Acidobacteriota bacterium]